MKVKIDNQEQRVGGNAWDGTIGRHAFSENLTFGSKPQFGWTTTPIKMNVKLDNQKMKLGVDKNDT